MFIAQKPAPGLVIAFVETFDAQERCRSAAFLAQHVGHLIARHQCNGMPRHSPACARADHLDLGFGRRSKVIKMKKSWLS